MEKYCLKWNAFEVNIRESFRKLREEQRLFDVTLATDDNDYVEEEVENSVNKLGLSCAKLRLMLACLLRLS